MLILNPMHRRGSCLWAEMQRLLAKKAALGCSFIRPGALNGVVLNVYLLMQKLLEWPLTHAGATQSNACLTVAAAAGRMG